MTSLEPIDVGGDELLVIREMTKAAQIYDVGPFAAVAGAVAQYVGDSLSPECSHLIIENGGDIYLKSEFPITLAVFAGENSPFAGKLQFRVNPAGKSLGVCTSSGTVGHSLSFGKADAVVTIAETAILADAAATSICNLIQKPDDIAKVINSEKKRQLLNALIIVMEDKMGAWGDIEFI
jgi:ApbE superfamily uncharacterized protein (UPF0280 family)